MTRTIIRSAVLLFRDAPAQAASNTTTISTMGAAVTRRDTACDFVMLGAGG